MNGAGKHTPAGSRLARFLAEPGAFAMVSPFGCGRIALYRSVEGTSLGAGYVAAAEAEALVAAGGAGWRGGGKQRRLIATAAARPRTSLASGIVRIEGVAQPVLLNERESPLLWLHRRAGKDGRPQISEAEFAAGERFRADLTLAGKLPRVTMNWDAAFAPDDRGAAREPAGATDAAIAAGQRVRAACERLGPELAGLAIDVCGFLKGLDQVERERGWPARSAKIVLRLALAALVAHYRLEAPARRARLSSWQAAGARPQLLVGEGGP